MKLSIIIPCFNEQRTIGQLIEKVLNVELGDFVKEIIVIDDASSDNSSTIVSDLKKHHPKTISLLQQTRNQGKGSAIRRGFKKATGDIVIIQDADLEYDPQDYQQMIALFRLPQVNVVFGSRRLLPGNKGSGLFYYWGAQVINLFTNLLYGARITDQFTCYKMFRRSILKKIPLHGRHFEIDAEFTAKLLRLKTTVQEVPITYNPRSKAQGKKIKFKDGIAWFWQIIKHRFTSPLSW